MSRQTVEVRAIWNERPGRLAPGMMQWVADVLDPATSARVADSPAFPIDDSLVDGDDDEANAYIRPDLSRMDDETRVVVQAMHENFVTTLERDGWTRIGNGPDWFNVRFSREVHD